MNFSARLERRELERARFTFDAAEGLIRREPFAGGEFILIGRVYEEFGALAELARRLEGPSPLPPGRFLFIRHDFDTCRLRLIADKFHLLNVMHSLQEQCFWLSNDTEKIPSGFSLTKDPVSVASLKAFGATLPPRTLFNEIKLILGKVEVDFLHGEWTACEHTPAWQMPEDPAEPDPGACVAELRRALDDILNHWQPKHFRLSGGADTRLISLLLPENARGQLRFQVLCHPDLQPEEDRDVIGARDTGRRLGVPVEVLRYSHHIYFLRPGGSGTYCLGGLYGGELLGGLMYRFAPWLAPAGEDLQDSEALAQARAEWREREARIGSKCLTVELFLSAFRSTIYESVEFSWSSPAKLQTVCVSPFVEPRILELILRTPDRYLSDYGLYYRMYRHLGALENGGALNSSIALYHSAIAPLTAGIDPKSITAAVPGRPAGARTPDLNLQAFFERHVLA